MNDLQSYYRELTTRLKALADSEPVRKVDEARQKALGELLERVQNSDLRERIEEAFQQQQRSLVDFARAVQGVLGAQQQAVAELISQVERNISERLPGRGPDADDGDELAPFPPPPAVVSAERESDSAPAAKKAVAKKTATKKAVAKKSTTKKAVAKKTPAKKAVAKSVDGSEPAAKKAAKKATAKKTAAKKAPAKKTAAKKAPDQS